MPPDVRQFEQAAARLRGARRVVVFTGAGVSAESGIATFRDPEGFWSKFPPEQFGNWQGLMRMVAVKPTRLIDFLLAVLEPLAQAEPNPAHRAIARLQGHTGVTVVTQNVDGLHQAAGSQVVHEVHGSLFEVVTLQGRTVRRLSPAQMQAIVEGLRSARGAPMSRFRMFRALRPMLGMSRRGLYRPAIVLFGEMMAEPAWSNSVEAVEACDCLISVGTSAAVFPAAGLVDLARRHGAKVITVDPAGGAGESVLRAPAGEALPALVEAAFGSVPPAGRGT